MSSSQIPEFGPNGAVLNSPDMTDEMRKKIAGDYRAPPLGELPLADRLIRMSVWGIFLFAYAVLQKLPIWVPLIPNGVMAAEAFRNGLARRGIERILWRVAGILSLLWFVYCLTPWGFGETRH